MMTQVIDHVSSRALATPRLTAARFGDCAVSYGDLDRIIHDYEPVLSRHGLGPSAALTAGIMGSLPSVSRSESVVEVLAWLSRTSARRQLARSATCRTGARAEASAARSARPTRPCSRFGTGICRQREA